MSTLDDEQTQVIVSNGNGNGHAPVSAFDVLRAKRAESVVAQVYDIDVTGYGGQLIVRCGPIPGSVLQRLRERHDKSRSAERDFNLNADVLLAAASEVRWRETVTADAETIVVDDEPVTLDERLATGLDLTATSGRELVRQLFGAAPVPELALATEVGGYLEWASSVNADADSTFVGESQAAPR